MESQTSVTKLQKIEKSLASIVKVACVILLASIVIVTAVSIFTRYIFFHPLNFANPLSIYLMMWVSLLGSGLAIRKGEHIFVDLFIRRFTGKKKLRILLLVNFITALFLLIMTIYGFQFAFTGLKSIDVFVFGISMLVPYLSVPVGMLYMLIVVILNTIIAFKKNPKTSYISESKGGS